MFDTELFDLDHTLVYTDREFEIDWTVRCIREHTGSEPNRETVAKQLEDDFQTGLERIMTAYNFPTVTAFLDMWRTPEAIALRNQGMQVYGDAEVLLKLKSQGKKLGLITGSNLDLAREPLKILESHLGERDLFDEIIFVHPQYPHKPNPKALIHCMIRMEAEPSRTRYIGDNHVEDVGAARRAGIHSVLVARNGSVPNGQYQPDTVVKSLRELI